MPHEDDVLRLARQYMSDQDFRDFMGLWSLYKGKDSGLRALVEQELFRRIDQLILVVEAQNDIA